VTFCPTKNGTKNETDSVEKCHLKNLVCGDTRNYTRQYSSVYDFTMAKGGFPVLALKNQLASSLQVLHLIKTIEHCDWMKTLSANLRV
jgi:hypothetical protein